MNLIKTCAAVALALGLTGAAHAAATYCSPNTTNANGLSLSDMTYNNGATHATDCFGFVSGNDNAGINGLNLNWGTDWTFLTKDDNPGSPVNGTGSFMGLNFTLSTTSGTSGGWLLTGVDTNGVLPLNLPTALDFVGVLKGSTSYALYFFDDVIFNGSNGGTWAMKITNKKGKFQDLSHLSLYVKQGDGVLPPIDVPEPSVLAMFGLGLVGLGLLRRRKN